MSVVRSTLSLSLLYATRALHWRLSSKRKREAHNSPITFHMQIPQTPDSLCLRWPTCANIFQQRLHRSLGTPAVAVAMVVKCTSGLLSAKFCEHWFYHVLFVSYERFD